MANFKLSQYDRRGQGKPVPSVKQGVTCTEFTAFAICDRSGKNRVDYKGREKPLHGSAESQQGD